MIRLDLDPTNGSLHVTGSDSALELFAGPCSWKCSGVGSLAEAVINLLSGLDDARAFWDVDGHPGLLRWQGEHINVRILEFRDAFTTVDDRGGRPVFDTMCRLADLAGQTLSVVPGVNDEAAQPSAGAKLFARQEVLLGQLNKQRKQARHRLRNRSQHPS